MYNTKAFSLKISQKKKKKLKMPAVATFMLQSKECCISLWKGVREPLTMLTYYVRKVLRGSKLSALKSGMPRPPWAVVKVTSRRTC